MSIGPWQIVIIVVLILVIFGRGKISGFMSELGKGITSFKKGLKEGDEEEKAIEKSPSDDEEAVKQAKAASKPSKK